MVSNPKISVIVPLYNCIEYFPQCMDSILAQSFKDFEIIVVDDGSTDGSYELAEQYAKTNGNVIALQQEHRIQPDDEPPLSVLLHHARTLDKTVQKIVHRTKRSPVSKHAKRQRLLLRPYGSVRCRADSRPGQTSYRLSAAKHHLATSHSTQRSRSLLASSFRTEAAAQRARDL